MPAEVRTRLEAIAIAPVFVEQVAVAKIGDAGAPQHAEPRKRRRVRASPHERLQPVAAALERRAMMRRAEEDDRLQDVAPGARRIRLAVGAADDEPSHAVRDDRELAYRNRPTIDEPIEERCELTTVFRNVPSAVVVEVDGRVAEV